MPESMCNIHRPIAAFTQPTRVISSEVTAKYIKTLFFILNVYGWFHFGGIFVTCTSGLKSSMLKILWICALVLSEGNAILYSATLIYKIDSSVKKEIIISAILLCFTALELLTRYFLLTRTKQILTLVDDLCRFRYRVTYLKKFQRNILISFFIIDIICIAGFYMVTTSGSFMAFSNNSETFVKWFHLVRFGITWKRNGVYAFSVFCFVCLTLTETFRDIRKSLNIMTCSCKKLIVTYNEALDVMKSANKVFSAMLVLCSLSSLGSTFFIAYNTLHSTFQLREVLLSFFEAFAVFGSFVAMCLIASNAQNIQKDVRDVIEMLPKYDCDPESAVAKLKPKFEGFTLLDSIVINKSLLLSAVGSLFTYGVLIATFNVSSK